VNSDLVEELPIAPALGFSSHKALGTSSLQRTKEFEHLASGLDEL
jgi:hypothetical protein